MKSTAMTSTTLCLQKMAKPKRIQSLAPLLVAVILNFRLSSHVEVLQPKVQALLDLFPEKQCV